MSDFIFVQKYGKEIIEFTADFAELRITVFREFPYLYEGNFEYEKKYIQTYTNASEAMLFAVYDNGKMIGATTCLPLKDEIEEIRQPFLQNEIDINKVFYFGESLLLKEYRGQGLGHRFFDEREKHAKSFQKYSICAFCAVEREKEHPLIPKDYQPHDVFWTKRGYALNKELNCQMSWLDIEQPAPTIKKLLFWTKNI